MADRDIALLDLHLRDTPAPPVGLVEELAVEGLVRLIGREHHADMVRRAELRAEIEDLDAERHGLRQRFVWPWRIWWRRNRIRELGNRIDRLTGQSRALRRKLHRLGLAMEAPELLTPIDDGRYATLTSEGANTLHAWAYSDAFDPHVDIGAGGDHAGWVLAAYDWLIREWGVAYPPPTVATAAALISVAGEERRDERLERLIALFTSWRRRYRQCPADRLMLGAMMVLASDGGEEPAAWELTALECREPLLEFGFPRERETLWAGAVLARHARSPVYA
ncbi:MAG: hypothetical protein GF393_07185, partial [Armatimonadia bacterium]|nr:hypothetical protein [Armatimonadia bacterium]